jgi:hypothetical protein
MVNLSSERYAADEHSLTSWKFLQIYLPGSSQGMLSSAQLAQIRPRDVIMLDAAPLVRVNVQCKISGHHDIRVLERRRLAIQGSLIACLSKPMFCGWTESAGLWSMDKVWRDTCADNSQP